MKVIPLVVSAVLLVAIVGMIGAIVWTGVIDPALARRRSLTRKPAKASSPAWDTTEAGGDAAPTD